MLFIGGQRYPSNRGTLKYVIVAVTHHACSASVPFDYRSAAATWRHRHHPSEAPCSHTHSHIYITALQDTSLGHQHDYHAQDCPSHTHHGKHGPRHCRTRYKVDRLCRRAASASSPCVRCQERMTDLICAVFSARVSAALRGVTPPTTTQSKPPWPTPSFTWLGS